jgi:hypothetical protein
MIIQVANETKDKHIINRLAKLAKHYKLYNEKKDLNKMNAILRSEYPHSRISGTNNITSEDKNKFIDFLARLDHSDSQTREQTLNRFLKSAPV